MSDFDILIVGAGIAGASIAAELSGHASILVIEAEDRPGYHATGRSAAFWTESYGGPMVQPLTTASGPFLLNPPTDFSDKSFLVPRGALHIGTPEHAPLLQGMQNDFSGSGIEFEYYNQARIMEKIPGIRPEWNIGLWEGKCSDIDVGALHQAYLRKAKKNGAVLACRTILQHGRHRGGMWHVETGQGNYTAKILVNAAGAWADDVARKCGVRPVGIQAYRRTILQMAVEPMAPTTLPLVIGVDGSFYFKPESGKIWLSPHDESPSIPCDAAPEEVDVARAIDRFEQIVDWQILRLEHKWAGLRSFAPDRLPVIGRDPHIAEFFWFAGQGGFGIQTAPATAQLAASILNDKIIISNAISASDYAPDRFV